MRTGVLLDTRISGDGEYEHRTDIRARVTESVLSV